jgi:hypothetical protein
MKIVSQSSDEMVLQEGNIQGIVIGAACIVAGVLAIYFLHSTKPMAVWIGLAAAALGVGVICFASSITVDATKSKDRLVYQKKRLIGAKISTYAISDVLRIETRKQWRIENAGAPNRETANPPQPVLVAQSVIVFKSGKELALDHQKNSSSMQMGAAVLMSGQGSETAMANRVAAFLGVPFQEIMPPNMMGMGGMGGGLNIQVGRR